MSEEEEACWVKKKVFLTMVILTLAVTGLITQVRISQVQASTTGITSSSDVSAYSDPFGRVILASFSWGTVTLNSPRIQSLYLVNSGNSAYMTIAPTLTNFVFKDKNGNSILTDYSQHFNVTLDRVGAIIRSKEIMSAKLTLVIDSGINPSVDSFSFNIVLNFNQLVSPADFNADGHMDFKDLTLYVRAYVNYFSTHAYNAAVDINHDGQIDFNDLAIFTSEYVQEYQNTK